MKQKMLSYEPKTMCPYLGILAKFDCNWPINSLNINTLERDQLNMKGKPKLYVLSM